MKNLHKTLTTRWRVPLKWAAVGVVTASSFVMASNTAAQESGNGVPASVPEEAPRIKAYERTPGPPPIFEGNHPPRGPREFRGPRGPQGPRGGGAFGPPPRPGNREYGPPPGPPPRSGGAAGEWGPPPRRDGGSEWGPPPRRSGERDEHFGPPRGPHGQQGGAYGPPPLNAVGGEWGPPPRSGGDKGGWGPPPPRGGDEYGSPERIRERRELRRPEQPHRAAPKFEEMDGDGDGKLTPEEYRAYVEKK